MTPRIRSALACAIGWTLLACGGAEETPEPAAPTPPPAASKSAAPAKPAKPPVPKTDDTGLEALMGADAVVPDEFPSDVPTYPGAVPTATMSAAGQGTLVTFDSNDGPELVFDFYEKTLVDQGWTIESSASMGDQWMLSALKGDRKTRVSIAAAPAGSQIGIAVAKAE